MCAAGTMPGALQVLWQAAQGGYHMEYGYSCMGYEIAGAMGIKLAAPEREVICFVGDGSYMMANSELATAVMRRIPFTVVLTDNRGYGCINRLQMATGGANFNNLFRDTLHETMPQIDFAAHAAAMGAVARKVDSIADLERALKVGDELGGHIVSGHVDGVAELVEMHDEGDSLRLTFEAPPELARFIASKGSVALNGTSLTVNEVNGNRFGINLIPHTQEVTTWGGVKVGDKVNLEIDTLARYVARLAEAG